MVFITPTVIEVDIHKTSHQANKELVKRLSPTKKEKTRKNLEADQLRASEIRNAIVQGKVNKAAEETRKIAAAHEASHTELVDLAKTTEEAIQKASENRAAMTLLKIIKASEESRKVTVANQRATSDRAMLARAKAEKQAAVATIININTHKTPNKKPKKGLRQRLSIAKPRPLLNLIRIEKASENRVAISQAKIAKAAEENVKLMAAQERATSDQAKLAKVKAEQQVAVATIINVDTQKNPKNKGNKALKKRLTFKKEPSLKTGHKRASELRNAMIQKKVEKAAKENRKTKAAQEKVAYKHAKLVKATTEAGEKALLLQIEMTRAKAAKAAKESIKVLENQMRATSDKAKAAKAKAEATAAAATVITVDCQKSPRKTPTKCLLARLNSRSSITPEAIKEKQERAAKNREFEMQHKLSMCVTEPKKLEAVLDKVRDASIIKEAKIRVKHERSAKNREFQIQHKLSMCVAEPEKLCAVRERAHNASVIKAELVNAKIQAKQERSAEIRKFTTQHKLSMCVAEPKKLEEVLYNIRDASILKQAKIRVKHARSVKAREAALKAISDKAAKESDKVDAAELRVIDLILSDSL